MSRELKVGERVQLSINLNGGEEGSTDTVSVDAIVIIAGSAGNNSLYYLDRSVAGRRSSWMGDTGLNAATITLVKALGLSLHEPRFWWHDKLTILASKASKYGTGKDARCPCGIHPDDCIPYHKEN